MILIGLIVILFLISCSTPPEVTPVPQSKPAIVVQEDTTPLVVSDTPIEEASALTPELAVLFSKNKETTNIYYFYDREKTTGYEVFIKGNKAKKVFDDAIKIRSDVYYTTIYLDLNRKTAAAACEKGGTLCSPIWNNAYNLDYEAVKLDPTPIDIIKQVKSAESVGSELFENKQLTIYEYTNPESQKERLSIDSYYGLPHRQVIYEGSSKKEEHTFTKVETGLVTVEDVTLPAKYKVMS